MEIAEQLEVSRCCIHGQFHALGQDLDRHARSFMNGLQQPQPETIRQRAADGNDQVHENTSLRQIYFTLVQVWNFTGTMQADFRLRVFHAEFHTCTGVKLTRRRSAAQSANC
jgi:hypothetical protein